MSEGRILIVEDDVDTAEMLRDVFSEAQYSVEVAFRGDDVLDYTRRHIPDLIILDILLPGMNGYTLCRELRTTTRTRHIPIIFLTQKDERNDRIAGLELGADDYITKPFDIEELNLRVKNAIQGHRRMNMTDPRSGLPAARLIEEQLRGLILQKNWAYIEIDVQHLQPFVDNYGFVAGDEVLRYMALMLNECIDELGTRDDFVGHAGGPIFVIITKAKNTDRIVERIRRRFAEEIMTHYNFMDSEEGGIRLSDGNLASLMRLSIGLVSAKMRQFSDIREITESAAEKRRLDLETASL
ncbi:MAG TPA: response regulator [Patescibacteria group bacterium]|nr:response regulator [Patescibacteria group bacterium]